MTLSLFGWIAQTNSLLFPQVISDQPCWSDCPDHLRRSIISTIWDSRKSSTISKYCLSLRKFLIYCREFAIPTVLPMSSLFVAQYLEHVKQSSKSAVKDALTAIKWLHYFVPGINSVNNPLNDDFLSRMVDSANRNNIKNKNRKRPLTHDIICSMIQNVPSNPTLTELRNALIPILAFALLLRHDELSHLNFHHFQIMDEGLKIHIPSSKTDTYREGKYVFLSNKNSAVHDMIFRYTTKANRSFSDNHFFFGPIVVKDRVHSLENRKLSYDMFNRIVKSGVANLGFDPKEFGTHSGRSGGATTLFPYVDQFQLLLSGRWADPRSLGSYVEVSASDRFDTNSKLNLTL